MWYNALAQQRAAIINRGEAAFLSPLVCCSDSLCRRWNRLAIRVCRSQKNLDGAHNRIGPVNLGTMDRKVAPRMPALQDKPGVATIPDDTERFLLSHVIPVPAPKSFLTGIECATEPTREELIIKAVEYFFCHHAVLRYNALAQQRAAVINRGEAAFHSPLVCCSVSLDRTRTSPRLRLNHIGRSADPTGTVYSDGRTLSDER